MRKYIFNFIIVILMFISMILSTFSITILNDKYIYKYLDKINYYDEVYSNIKEQFTDNLLSSGLDEETILKSVNKEYVEQDINTTVKSLLNHTKLELKSNEIKNNINNNINLLLNNKDFTNEDKKNIDNLVNTLVDIYNREIAISINHISKISKIIKYLKYGVILLNILLLLIILIRIIYMVVKKRYNELGISIMSLGFISILFKYLVGYKYMSILIFNKTLSNMIVNLIKNYITYIFIEGLFFTILGLIIIIVSEYRSNKLKN